MNIEYIADDIVIFLIQRKIISIEKRDFYQYGAEVALLNLINILMALLITVFSGTWQHFLSFLIIFIPLRITVGGYHAKTSTACLIISTFLYIVSVIFSKYLFQKFNGWILLAITLLSVLSIIIMAPVEHKNNPLGKKSRKKNRIISISLASVDSIIFVVLALLKSEVASSVMTFIILAALLMIIGKVHNSFQVE